MVTIETNTLKELVLRTEPDFLTQKELEINGFGNARKFTENGDYVWVWNKQAIRSTDDHTLNYLVLKITEQ